MANLKTKKPRPAETATGTTGRRVRNAQGGIGFEMDLPTQLYTTAVTRFYNEDSFYQPAGAQADSFEDLCAAQTQADPAWMNMFVPWLRSEAGIRTSSLVAAVQYVLAGGPEPRSIIDAACQRADEPGEIITYWNSQTTKNMPKGMKRGLADACQRLYTQRAWVKWDSARADWKFADVIKYVHPSPVDETQSSLFKFILDHAGHGDGWEKLDRENLWLLANTREIDVMPEGERRDWLTGGVSEGVDPFKGTGYTWERLSGWLPGGMDAAAWEAIIPQMYTFAMIRNIRNFEEAGIGEAAVEIVRAKLRDPEETKAARIMPLNLWTSYRVSETMDFGRELQTALTNVTDNIPPFNGSTCVLVDLSGSMGAGVSSSRTNNWQGHIGFGRRSQNNEVSRAEQGAVFAAAIKARNKNARVFGFGTTWAEADGHHSMMGAIRNILALMPGIGASTRLWHSAAEIEAKHGPFDRYVIITDEQESSWGSDSLPDDTPVYICNVAAYGNTTVDPTKPNRHILAGLTDKMFEAIPRLEARKSVSWEDMFTLSE